ncbi:MobF family relaxase [Mycobacteroides abscessus]|uniref:MobF family relaxase n=1 Tax=Mycobacteroides abscessus TaxID=36809 RepID=UPI001877B738|nr:MobF family relaxase [Mycobacteroides abscessus]
MLTISKLGQWSVSYYVDTARSAAAAALESRSSGGGLGEYYSEAETRLPVWLSAGRDASTAMQLTGVGRNGESANLDEVTRWLNDGESPCGATGRAFGKRASVHGYDLTFCAPKSVSLMRALGDDVTAKAVADAHAVAIAEAMEYLAEHGGYTRVHNPRTGEKDLVRLPGIVAANFQHETSRAGDPHLHTHVLVSNRQARADGTLVSLDGTSLYHEARAAGIIYQATLRRELTRMLGIEWGEVDPRTGMAEIAGAHRGDLRSWSQRATQLREWAAGHLRLGGEQPSAGQLATAQKATRPRKPENVAWVELRGAWVVDERTFRVDVNVQQAARDVRRAAGVDYASAVRRAVSHGLKQAAFTRADLVEAIGARLPVDDADGPSPREVIERLADDVALRIGDERAAHQREGSIRYTAADLVAEERAIVELMGRRDTRAALPSVDTAGLSPDQARAVTAIATSERLVQPLSAPAGAGKTHSLRALRRAANAAGKRVLVVAPTGRAVDVAVREQAGDRGATLDALLGQLERGTEVLDSDTLVIVDEAGMVGTQHLRTLLDAATAAGTKVVPVGDEHQLAPVAQRGGTFAQLVTDLPWAQRLSEVWRMHDHDERDASLAVREGGPAALRRAVGWYRRQDRLYTGDAVTMADDARAAWQSDITAGRDALLIADRWEMADAINIRIHAERIDEDAPTVSAARGHRLAAGDVVITRHNTIDIDTYTDHTLATAAESIRNGQRWEVLAVDPDQERIAARRLDDGALATLAGDYLRQQVHLGYAVTVHAAQGVTADTCHTLLSADSATRAIAYVGLTRGRHTNTVHLYDTRAGEGDHEHAETVPGQHTARRGTPGEAAAALRRVLGRNEHATTITAAAREADEGQLPQQVAELRRYHRAVTNRLRREHRTERHTAQDRSMHARMHASDRALVEVLGAATRHANPLPLPLPTDAPIALTAPYVVATMSSEDYTPELTEAITTAAADAGRNLVRISATPQPGQVSLAQLAKGIRDHPAPAGAIVVVEDATTAHPAHLAAVATALVAAHGRLLLIDSGEPGNARRLLDGLALPWNENPVPAIDIDDPVLAATADRHRAAAARSWQIRTNPPTRDRSRDRDRGYGLDID